MTTRGKSRILIYLITDKNFRLIKKLIGAKLIFNKKLKKWSLKYEN
jgi:hypothetical protein